MKHSFLYDQDAYIIAAALFVFMLIALKGGYAFGTKKVNSKADYSGIFSSLLGLLALLLAFTFSMAESRYADRKKNVIQECNDIGTAILRSDIYSEEVSKLYRADFEKYLEARIAYFESGRDDAKLLASAQQTAEISKRLWERTTVLAKEKDFFIQSNMMIPALNNMFDIATTTNASYLSSVPDSIVVLLLLFSVISAFYVGYSSAFKKSRVNVFAIGFCLLTSIVIYVTLDLERPRRGIIKQQEEIMLLKALKAHF